MFEAGQRKRRETKEYSQEAVREVGDILGKWAFLKTVSDGGSDHLYRRWLTGQLRPEKGSLQ